MKATTSKCFLVAAITIFSMTFTAQAQRSTPAAESTALLEAFEAANNSPRALTAISQAEWTDYSERLSQTLVAEETGLQQSVLQRIIRYGAFLPADKTTIFEVVKIYRNHDGDRMRRMAVIVPGELEDGWAMGFLKRAVKFEQNEQIAHTFRVYPKTCFEARARANGPQARRAKQAYPLRYVDAAERSLRFVQSREARMRFSDRLYVLKNYDGSYQ